MPETIIILDFGSQYAQLIARRVRELHVYCELYSWKTPPEILFQHQPRAFILSGGPASVYAPLAPRIPEEILQSELPILGICYGMQALTHALGGKVSPTAEQEYGLAELTTVTSNPLIPEGTHTVWMSHGDRIESLPEGFQVLAKTGNSPVGAMGDTRRSYFGVQFHPEVNHTLRGKEFLANFLFQICGVSPGWTPSSIISEQVNEIRARVGQERVLAAVSGGVDSSVAAALVHRAVGNQLEAVFVDNGLMREGEAEEVVGAFQDHLGVRFHPINAVESFLDNLKGVRDPEMKRRIIGERFIRIFEKQAILLGHPPFLVQGTIYPDVVESRAPDREDVETIKTHHNVGGLPEDMEFTLIEPLRYLFKDEVRAVGEELGLPRELVWRQPFPGPGLAVRCLGEVTRSRLEKLRRADAIFREILAEADLLRMHASPPDQPDVLPRGSAQAFAVLLPVQAVGVMGDQRTYQDVIALRAVTTDDYMTADWARFPPEVLAAASTRIVNEVDGVNRVVYDITSKPPATIEWE